MLKQCWSSGKYLFQSFHDLRFQPLELCVYVCAHVCVCVYFFTHAEVVTTEDGTLFLLKIITPSVGGGIILIVVVILMLITVILLCRKYKYSKSK